MSVFLAAGKSPFPIPNNAVKKRLTTAWGLSTHQVIYIYTQILYYIVFIYRSSLVHRDESGCLIKCNPYQTSPVTSFLHPFFGHVFFGGPPLRSIPHKNWCEMECRKWGGEYHLDLRGLSP